MFNAFENLIQGLVGFTTSLATALIAFLVLLILIRRFRGRKQILFDPWSDLRPNADEVLGRSVGEMLLHRLGSISSIHENSIDQVEISNSYRDIPIVAQGLEDDMELLGSAQLGSAPGVITALFVFMLKAFPFLSPPTRLRGSIHMYGARYRLQAILQNYKHPVSKRRCNRLWEVETAKPETTDIPEVIEELGYRIYMDLLRERAFKSWECFREFTLGLGQHISFMDLGRPADDQGAESHYRMALGLEPQNQVVSYNLGVLIYTRFASEDSNEAALDFFRVALTAPNDHLRARANSAMANALLTRVHRFKAGDLEDLREALELAEHAVKLQPKLDAAAKAYAYAHHQIGEWLYKHSASAIDPRETLRTSEEHRYKALKGYERALKLNPAHYVAANNLSNLQLEWAKTTKEPRRRKELLVGAERAADKALRANPSFHLAHDNLGNVRLEQGDYSEALLAYQAALRFKPDYPEARNDIAALLLDSRYERASGNAGWESHLEALSMTADQGRREKLCEQFARRVEALRVDNALVPGFKADVSRDSPCVCSGLTTSPRANSEPTKNQDAAQDRFPSPGAPKRRPSWTAVKRRFEA
ncbi:MAG TPA: tetratricopeptide repeat protein [Actinomycetota bacterium]|nr:tetratricopeptide repeat protein [Actinomycetota bacterium]